MLGNRKRKHDDDPYLCKCCANFVFEWTRRRRGYRLGFFFNILAVTNLLGNVITLGVFLLITNRDFFKNYRCGEKAIRFITMDFLALMTVTGAAALSALMMARVLNLFNKYPISEFMGLGKWINSLGCIMKWVPMFTTLCFLAWFIIIVLSTTWIFMVPEDWCSRRWSYKGIAAVSNCRSWYRSEGKCIDIQENARIEAKKVRVCNDGEELSSLNFFWFTPKDENVHCSITDIAVCKAYKNLFSSLGNSAEPVDWSGPGLSGCLGPTASSLPPEEFMVGSDDTSDLYRYLLMYCIGWIITFLTLTLLYFYIKYSSKMDSIFHLPSKPRENVILKLFRPCSPFTH